MYSKHNCKNFIPILTNDAEHVCSKCAMVLEEKVEIQYLTGMQLHTPHIPICDENRYGSDNISPDGFTGKANKKLNPTNKKILSARQKPQRMLFTNTCTAIGLGIDHSRTALSYYDMLHNIRDTLKQNYSKTNIFSKIISTLKKSETLTESNVISAMISSMYWNSTNDIKQWIDLNFPNNTAHWIKEIENISKIKKPKKLSTLNISFFSIYQVVCDNNIRLNKNQIATAITQHMHFRRKLRMASALTVCKTVLNLEKKRQMKTPILQHDILLESADLPSEKMKRAFYLLAPMISSKQNARKIKKELEIIS